MRTSWCLVASFYGIVYELKASKSAILPSELEVSTMLGFMVAGETTTSSSDIKASESGTASSSESGKVTFQYEKSVSNSASRGCGGGVGGGGQDSNDSIQLGNPFEDFSSSAGRKARGTNTRTQSWQNNGYSDQSHQQQNSSPAPSMNYPADAHYQQPNQHRYSSRHHPHSNHHHGNYHLNFHRNRFRGSCHLTS